MILKTVLAKWTMTSGKEVSNDYAHSKRQGKSKLSLWRSDCAALFMAPAIFQYLHDFTAIGSCKLIKYYMIVPSNRVIELLWATVAARQFGVGDMGVFTSIPVTGRGFLSAVPNKEGTALCLPPPPPFYSLVPPLCMWDYEHVVVRPEHSALNGKNKCKFYFYS